MLKEMLCHSLSSQDVLKKLDSNKNGLDYEEVTKRRKIFGLNVLPEENNFSKLKVLFNQLRSVFIYILLLAAFVSYYVGNLIDVYVIIGIIFINTTIGFVQEQKAEKAINTLKKMVVSKTRVYRGGVFKEILAKELVPGDIISLTQGDKIPADARLLEIKDFSVNESSLTGESVSSVKSLKLVEKLAAVADRKNMVFFGTFVAGGKALAVVTSIGARTEIGKLATSLKNVKVEQSHFQKKTNKLAMQMGVFALIGALLVFLIGYFVRGESFSEIFVFTLSALVSGIPEGLPAVLVIVLSIGAFRMAKKKAIMRHLSSTETLAVVDTIITDKTGTLTENTMTVEKIYLPGQNLIKVSGEGWKPDGEFMREGKIINNFNEFSLMKILKISEYCNDAFIVKGDKKYTVIGDPTEAALSVLAEKSGVDFKSKKLDDLPFNQISKYRACSVSDEKENELYSIGAPENILDRCEYFLKKGRKVRLSSIEKKKILEGNSELTRSALRVIGLAYKNFKGNDVSEKDVKEMIFVGFVGMKDPPRKEVKGAISRARGAGIRIIMATGDHKETALAVAKDIGLLKKGDFDKALSGDELEKLDDGEFRKAVRNVNVFARLSPEMKLKIASTLQSEGKVIAMTGDGVNDAPALKKADIGISMGLIGTDVARESSEIVLEDDNFAAIVDAVEQGRIVFNNVRRTSFFLVTTNVAEHATIISALAFGLPLPLLPTQILWLNLVTDTAAGVGLSAEPGHEHVLYDKPRKKGEDILNKEIVPFLLIMVISMTVLVGFVFSYFLGEGIEKARTTAFLIMSFTQLWNSVNLRSLKKSIFSLDLFGNKTLVWALGISFLAQILVMYVPFLQRIFGFVSLSLIEFVFLVAISGSVLLVGELYKRIKFKDLS